MMFLLAGDTLKPEKAELGENFPFFWDRGGQNPIEGANAIGCDDE